jgi:hypothetical protein
MGKSQTKRLGLGKFVVPLFALFASFFSVLSVAGGDGALQAINSPFRAARSWVVAPGGSPSGDGSISRPWDLQTALWGGLTDEIAARDFSNHLVRPGDTVLIREGAYRGPHGTLFVSTLRGTEARPIVIRPYPGERAVVDPGIKTWGSIVNDEIDYDRSSAHNWYWGFEITNTQRRNLPASERWKRGPGLQFIGQGHKAINMVLRDIGHAAIQAGEWAEGAEIYGCIIWGAGFYQYNEDGSVTIRGSGVYAQNKTDTRLVSDLISFRNFTTGMKTWSQETHGYGFIFDGNIAFDNGNRNIFAGSDHRLRDLTLTHNATYRVEGDTALSVQVGYSQNVNNMNLLVAHNYIVGGSRSGDQGALSLQSWVSGEVYGNTIVEHGPGSGAIALVGSYYEPESGKGMLYIHDNRWFGPSNRFWINYWNGYRDYSFDILSFAAWANRIGYDASRHAGFDPSTNRYTQALPEGTSVLIRPNKYETGRAHIAVYNWDHDDRVAVDLSRVLEPGDRFEIIDVQNYFGSPVAQGVYNGGRVNIPMNLSDVQPLYDPYGEIDHLDDRHTAPEFAAFLLRTEDGARVTPTPGGPPGPTETPGPEPTGTPDGLRVTLNPIADTRAKASAPAANFGSAQILKIDYAPDPREVVYLLFDLSPLDGATITSAKLRLYITNGSEMPASVRRVEDISWTESGLTYSNRPLMRTPVGVLDRAPLNDWVEVDLTAYILEREGPLVSLGMDTLNPDGIAFHSRENLNPPELVVSYEFP